MKFERGKRFSLRIDIASLVDVVFLLLLFFMLTSRLVVTPAIQVDLPDSATAEVQPPEEVVVSLSEQGQVYLGEEAVSLEGLPLAIGQLLDQGAGQGLEMAVRVRADRDAAVGMLIRVVDGLKLGGCTSFSIETGGIENDRAGQDRTESF